jgi:pyruvate dehydrogenase E2 component (dihydrolipoamide acetyltransferase)
MDVKVPKLGEGADSGVVVSILVRTGDRVEEGQTILELENEKAVAPIPSSASGTVSKLHVKEGDTVSVGQTLLTLSDRKPSAGATSDDKPKDSKAATKERDEETDDESSEPAEAESRREPPARRAGATGTEAQAGKEPLLARPISKVAASPAIRKLARELGLDLARVRGTERGGRVGMGDVRAYIRRLQEVAFGQGPAEEKSKAKPAPAAEPVDFAKWGRVTRKPLSQLRKTIAARMASNWSAIPHVTQFDEADVTDLMALRKKHAGRYEAEGARLTLTGFIFKAVAATLGQHPTLNSSLDEGSGELVFKEYCHIGLAVDTEAGLIVPVLRDVDSKSLLDVSREIEELAASARDRKVSREQLQGGSFTISNQGGIGGAHFTPIVNKPEVAILGLGRGAPRPVVRGDKIEARVLLPLALSYDHRVIDGGTAARFMVDLVQAIEGFDEATVRLGKK